MAKTKSIQELHQIMVGDHKVLVLLEGKSIAVLHISGMNFISIEGVHAETIRAWALGKRLAPGQPSTMYPRKRVA
jgi:hypothetical protein